MSWLTGGVAKLIGTALLLAAIGAGVWYFIYLVDSRASCRSNLAALRHAEAEAAASARAAQEAADAASIAQARQMAAQAAVAASEARAAVGDANKTISSLRRNLAAVEANSPSAKAQGALCLDPAIRQAEGFAEKCP